MPVLFFFGLNFICLYLCILLHKFINSSCRIYYFLFAGEEGMAVGADIDREIFSCGFCLNYISTGTGDCAVIIFRMNLLLHLYTSKTRSILLYYIIHKVKSFLNYCLNSSFPFMIQVLSYNPFNFNRYNFLFPTSQLPVDC